MSTHSYIGIPDPEQPGQALLRFIHSDGYPTYMIPTLRAIWSRVAERDTHRLGTLLLAYDWDYLDPDTTDGSTSTALAGEQLIPGVGMTLTVTESEDQPLPPGPVTVRALTATGDLDAAWIYLLDVDTDAVIVHTSGGVVFSSEPLAS